VQRYEAQFGANDSTYWLVFELLWRDYFRFMFKKHKTKYFLYEGIKTEKVLSKSLNEKLLSQWINGTTNSDFINAKPNFTILIKVIVQAINRLKFLLSPVLIRP
jgi:deoxyribodipyrimidine photo-lyase